MLEQLLEDGWNYHDTESERLAGELEAVVDVPPQLLPQFIELSTHTLGAHLGDWARALVLGQRVLRSLTPEPQTTKAWETLYGAAVLAADAIGAAELELAALSVATDPFADFISMRLALAAALAGSGRSHPAGRLYRHALSLAGKIGDGRAPDHAVATASNNLAWTLHDLAARSPEDDEVMKLAAEASLAAWRRCGDWINEELALYLNASVALVSGQAAVALELASAGLAVIAHNGRRSLGTARFHLLRAVSLAALDDEKGRAAALVAADAAAAELTADTLKKRYAVDRANAIPSPTAAF